MNPEQPNNNQPFDERVDRYLLGKMSEEEELQFEVEYLDNPKLLAEVEMVEHLIRGLQLNKDTHTHAQAQTEQEAKTGLGAQLAKWFSEWFTPQTAWGAVAATVFLVPLMTLMNAQQSGGENVQQVQGTYVHLLGQKVRSSTPVEDIITIEPNQKSLVIGFTSEPTFGIPDPLSVKVYDANDQVIFSEDNLTPDYRWTVYLSLSNVDLAPGKYRYELATDGQLVTKGQFNLQVAAAQ